MSIGFRFSSPSPGGTTLCSFWHIFFQIVPCCHSQPPGQQRMGCKRKSTVNCESLILKCSYRLAPEHTFPAAVSDAVEAVINFLTIYYADYEVDASRVVLFGDSAGGTLATVVAQKLRYRADVPEIKVSQIRTVRSEKTKMLRFLGASSILSRRPLSRLPQSMSSAASKAQRGHGCLHVSRSNHIRNVCLTPKN